MKHLVPLALIAGYAISSADVSAETCANYGQEFTSSGDYYILNNGYSVGTNPNTNVSPVDICGWLVDKDNWGGSLDFNDYFGGAGVSITWGKWPWGGTYTTGSFPIPIEDPTPQISNWEFNLGTPSVNNWNMFWEIWSQPCTDCEFGPITGDIMIHPTYGEVAGEKFPSVTFDGVTWDVYSQPPVGGRNYYIVHYYRQQQTTRTGDVDLAKFWRHSADNGWASGHVTSITAGLEMSRGRANFQTTKFELNAQNPSPVANPAAPQPGPYVPPGVDLSGTYRLSDGWQGRYLHSDGNFDGALLQSAPLNATWTSQQWVFERQQGDIYRIRNQWTGKYLTAPDNTQWSIVENQFLDGALAEQLWHIEAYDGDLEYFKGKYRIKNHASGMYLHTQQNGWSYILQANLREDWSSMIYELGAIE